MNKLKQVIFIRVDDVYRAVGQYVSRGLPHYQGDVDQDPQLITLHESSSFWSARREGKSIAYANGVPFADLVSEPFMEAIAKLKKA